MLLNIPFSLSIGSAITSATEGSVLFAGVGGILQQDNANFFWDNTNNRLGIGTASPLSLLTVGSIASNLNSNFYSFGYGAASTSGSNIRVGTLAQSNDANPFVLYLNAQGNASAASRQMILQTGNDGVDNLGTLALQYNGGVVGIGGTIYSSEKLNVAGHVALDFTDPALYLNDIAGGGKKFSLQSFDARFRIYNNTASTEAFTIDNSGFCGIGESTPTARLHVKGSGPGSGTFALKIQNSASADLFNVRDDGNVGIGIAAGTSTLFVKGIDDVYTTSVFQVVNSSGRNLFNMGNRGDITLGGNSGGALGNAHLEIDNTSSGGPNILLLKKSNSATAQTVADDATQTWYTAGVANSNYVGSTGDWRIGATGAASAQLEVIARSTVTGMQVLGEGTTSSSSSFIAKNSGGVAIVTARNDKVLIANGRFTGTQGADVASVAGAIELGYDGNTFEITGTNAITLISNLGWQNGSEVNLVFTTTATLTDGTANSGTDIGMELFGGVNFVATADDMLTLVLCEVGGTQRWREKCRSVNA